MSDIPSSTLTRFVGICKAPAIETAIWYAIGCVVTGLVCVVNRRFNSDSLKIQNENSKTSTDIVSTSPGLIKRSLMWPWQFVCSCANLFTRKITLNVEEKSAFATFVIPLYYIGIWAFNKFK